MLRHGVRQPGGHARAGLRLFFGSRLGVPSSLRISAFLSLRNLAGAVDQPFPGDEKSGAPRHAQGLDAAAAAELGSLDISFPTFMVWGANTGVGKTIVSAGLAAVAAGLGSGEKFAANRAAATVGGGSRVLYLKPVQTGHPEDCDSRWVLEAVSSLSTQIHPHPPPTCTIMTPCEQRQIRDPTATTEFSTQERLGDCHLVPAQVLGVTMWTYRSPISPHLAAAQEGRVPPDGKILEAVRTALGGGQACPPGEFPGFPDLSEFLKLPETRDAGIQDNAGKGGDQEPTPPHNTSRWALVETAGGVASPGPSGSLQCDLYRPLRIPALLVGDGRLGGISATIAAYETLLLRGYDISAVVLLEDSCGNSDAVRAYLGSGAPVVSLPSFVPLPGATSASAQAAFCRAWLEENLATFETLHAFLEAAHVTRLQSLASLKRRAADALWWPFTQHQGIRDRDITAVDSRCGETFTVLQGLEDGHGPVRTEQQFDASASWWTQGPSAALQAELAREVGHTIGRYGHVMFPETAHMPAVRCAELLLSGPGRGWADRVFFSDNGSTAIEVALKMAFRLFLPDLQVGSGVAPELLVVALAGSYHGDTLGAQQAQAPSVFTGFLQQPWYTGKGLFLAPPKVACHSGQWRVTLPPGLLQADEPPIPEAELAFPSRDEVYDAGRDQQALAGVYSSYVERQLAAASDLEDGTLLAALLLEPVIHGAGGMELVDPLFQRQLVRSCRQRGIPVIFDEVFAGCWRLGVQSAAELLHCLPDISCYAKLLTGGLVPLAATLASEKTFRAFLGPSKLEALLHGHSYSAHPIGCAAAALALQRFRDPVANPNYDPARGRLRELWDPVTVDAISRLPGVARVVALGTIFAVELQTGPESSGYASTAAKDMIHGLREEGIFARPLGSVLYIMCAPATSPALCASLLSKVFRQLSLRASGSMSGATV